MPHYKEMVQNKDWGPSLWNILHTCAEQLGKSPVQILLADEIRIWVQLLKVTEGIMPCALCRKHYSEWKKQHPPDAAFNVRLGAEHFKDAARKWVWELHEQVNQRNGQPSFAFENLGPTYSARKKQDLQKDLDTLLEILKKAAILREVEYEYVKQWKGRLDLLRKMIGL
jgi:hypothetical protein